MDLRRLRLFSIVLGVEETEELENTCDFKGMAHPLVDADEAEKTAIFIMGNVGADQGADAGGVDVRDGGKIDNESWGTLCSQSGLELEQRTQHDRSLQAENSLSGTRAVEILDGKWLVSDRRHRAILAF